MYVRYTTGIGILTGLIHSYFHFVDVDTPKFISSGRGLTQTNRLKLTDHKNANYTACRLDNAPIMLPHSHFGYFEPSTCT